MCATLRGAYYEMCSVLCNQLSEIEIVKSAEVHCDIYYTNKVKKVV